MSTPAPASDASPAPGPGAREHGPPFRGWRIAFMGIAAQTLGIGMISAYGVFVLPVIAEFDASMKSITLGYSAFMVVGSAIGPLLGPALDRRSVRMIMLGGVSISCTTLVLLSRVPALWQVGVLFVFAAAGMQMYGALPVQVLLVRWFTLHRGRALSLAALGIGVPMFFVPPIAAALIEALGWRGAVAIIALCSAAIAAPLIAWLVIDHPRDIGQHPDGVSRPPGDEVPVADAAAPSSRDLLRDGRFWLLACCLSLMFGASYYYALFLVPFLESMGVPGTRAAWVLTLFAGFSIAGKLGSAAISDRVDVRRLIWGLLLLQGAAWVVLIAWPSVTTTFIAVIGFGLGAGGIVPLPALVLSACFGPQILGRVTGLMGPVRLPFIFLIPFVGGWLVDLNGGGASPSDYLPTFGLGLTWLAATGLILAWVHVPSRTPTPARVSDT